MAPAELIKQPLSQRWSTNHASLSEAEKNDSAALSPSLLNLQKVPWVSLALQNLKHLQQTVTFPPR